MSEERMTRSEWVQRAAAEAAERDIESRRVAREELEARKAHERLDLTDEELAGMARHHNEVEQWSCHGCWHGHTCKEGRLIREVQRRRADEDDEPLRVAVQALQRLTDAIRAHHRSTTDPGCGRDHTMANERLWEHVGLTRWDVS